MCNEIETSQQYHSVYLTNKCTYHAHNLRPAVSQVALLATDEMREMAYACNSCWSKTSC